MKLNWGTSLVLFFAIFLSLAAVFIVFSLRQNNDLVTEDYYEKGADYTTDINIQRRSAVFSDSISFVETDQVYKIHIAPSLAGQVKAFNMYFFRPSDKQKDVKISMESDTALYLDKTLLTHGRYKLHLSWELNDEHYRITKDLMIR